MMDKIKTQLIKFKYPLIILTLGLTLLLFPGRKEETVQQSLPAESELLQQALHSVKGVGRAYVLISDDGVIVVCDGADNAAARLDIFNAVKSYTGFSTDKITVLKMAK